MPMNPQHNEANAAAEAKITILVKMHTTQTALSAWVEANEGWDQDDYPESKIAEHAALDNAAMAAWDEAHARDDISMEDRILASTGKHPLALIRLARKAQMEADRAVSAAIRAAEDEDALRNVGVKISNREIARARIISKAPLA